MRILLSATAGLLFCMAPAFADDENAGGALGQLQDATSGQQTLDQTYGDSTHGPGCPDACPTGNTDVPEPPPPTPADDDSSTSSSSDDDNG